ncbi:MAG: HAMP domain-containing sensor histidine kinase [Myxococcota bacterium]
MDAWRRTFGRWASLGLALLALLLLRLGVTFREEWDEVGRGLSAERAALELVARRSTELELSRLVERAQPMIALAEQDPLAEAPGLVLFVDGVQVLPRISSASPLAPNLFEARRDAYLKPVTGRVGAEDPVLERQALVTAVIAAIDRHDAAAIDRGMRAWWVHRTRVRLAPVEELASAVAVYERFSEAGDPAPSFMRAVLDTGLSDPKLGRLVGLKSELLSHRSELSEADLRAAARRISALAAAHGLDTAHFEALAFADPAAARVVWPETSGPTLISRGPLLELIVPSGNRRLGVPVELATLASEVAQDLRQRELLAPEDQLSIEAPAPGAAVAVSSLTIHARRARWPLVSERARVLFAEKTGLLFLCFGLATGVVLLAAFAERRKLELLEHKTEFVATVSHELRTPLAAVRVMAETLSRRLGEDPRAKDYPARIVKETDRLSGLVENILSFQRLDRGRWRLSPSWVRIADLLPALKEEAERAAKAPVTLSQDGLGGASVWADPELLELALLNLVRNGCRYNARSPVELRVGVTVGAEIRIRVEDNGVGVPEDERGSIFLPYVRGKGGSGRGTGLGLALVSKVMQLHQGSASLVRSGPEGSCFELCFPARPEAPQGARDAVDA